MAAVRKAGKQSSRIVDVTFLTGGQSRKAADLRENHNVSVVFAWISESMQRQVRVVGKVEPLPTRPQHSSGNSQDHVSC